MTSYRIRKLETEYVKGFSALRANEPLVEAL
jgi:hypothetical protein